MDNYAELQFNQTFSDLTSDEIIAAAKKRLSDFRFAHCVRTAVTATNLARQYSIDEDRAKLAGFLHDYSKEVPVEEYQDLIRRTGFDLDLLNWNRGIWHGVVGAWYVEHELHIYDQQILDAIRNHTTGAPDMTPLDKVIFMADYIEPGRNFEGVQQAREITAVSLDEGVGFQLRHTLTYLIQEQSKVYPKTLASYNVWGIKPEFSDKNRS